jgi:hypothetical protein
MKHLTFSAILTGALVAPASACDLCAVYSAMQARGETDRGLVGGAAEQFTRFGVLQEDGREVPNDARQFLDSSITQVLLGYNFADRFGVQVNLPIIHRSFQRTDDAGDPERGHETGVGDLSMVANFMAYRRATKEMTMAWTLHAGVKLPTGNSRRLEEEVDELSAPPLPPGAPESGVHGHDLTLGSGSFDGILGTGMFARWHHWFFSATAQYAIRSRGDFDYQFANDLTWSGGPGFYLVLNEDYTVALQFNVSGESKERDTFQGGKAEDTGITSVFLGPQVSLTWTDQLSAEAGIEVPVSLDNTALQIVPDYRVRAGLSWRF